MSSVLIQNPLDNIDKKSKKISKKNKKQNSDYENKENIQNNIPHQILIDEDLQSSKKLEEKKEEKKEKKSKRSKRDCEKIKEITMRNEVDKIYNETERLKQEYAEKKSNYDLFENPQFKKFIKNVEIQLLFLLSLVVLFIFLGSVLMINSSNKEYDGFSIACIIITTILFANTILLIVSVQIGLLNEPELSKAFRLFVALESIILITCFCFNFVNLCLNINKKNFPKFLALSLFLLIIINIIFVFKKSLSLFIESYMILLGKKTEYSVLISRESQINKSDIVNNSLSNLYIQTGNNEDLNKTNSVLLNNNVKKIEENKSDENSKNFFFYNRFHYSVSSDRKNDYSLNNFKKI